MEAHKFIATVRNILSPFARAIELILLANVIVIASLCINEVSSRAAMDALLSTSEATAQKTYIERSTRLDALARSAEEQSEPSASDAKPSPSSQDSDSAEVWISTTTPAERRLEEAEKLMQATRLELFAYQVARQHLARLRAVGAGDKEPDVAYLDYWVRQVAHVVRAMEFPGSREVDPDDMTEEDILQGMFESDTFDEEIRNAYYPMYRLKRLPSDTLLVIVVILSAILGSVVALLRADSYAGIRTVTLGAATGFVVFLALKGGHHIFLAQPTPALIEFNPYSIAFSGLIAGMFSPTAYALLSSLVHDLADRVGGKKGDETSDQENRPETEGRRSTDAGPVITLADRQSAA